MWEHPDHGARLLGFARAFAAGTLPAGAISTYLQHTVVETLTEAYGRRRGATMATAIVGFIFARYVLGLETFARLSPAEAAGLLYDSLR